MKCKDTPKFMPLWTKYSKCEKSIEFNIPVLHIGLNYDDDP